jgi:hypothetical protein
MISFLTALLASFVAAWAVIVAINTRDLVFTVASRLFVVIVITMLFLLSGVLFGVAFQ